MEHSRKLIYNTLALSIKILLTCIVQLIGTRIALSVLGDEAFGLYNLLAGLIILFSFVTGALLISTQRYLSISIGANDIIKLKSIFNVSLLIHIIITIFLTLLLISIKSFLFNDILNIGAQYISTAKVMYNILILSIIITISTIPYSAAINAHEDMVYFAFTEIVSLAFKLLAAITLLYIKGDHLLIYTWLMLLAIAIGALMKIVWCHIKYSESKLSIHTMVNKPLFNEMIGFVSWNTLGSASVVIRNQGVAVLLNMFFGTVVNAAYGIANQVNSLVLSFASTLTTVFTPSIVQNKGAGNETRMLEIAIFSSKLSFCVSTIMALPILTYLNKVLIWWLKDIPTNTSAFVYWIVLSFLIQQLYPGINRAIYASGKIKAYQISISLILIAIIPIGYTLLKLGLEPKWIIIALFILQCFTLMSTIYYAQKECGLNSKEFYIKSVLYPIAVFSLLLLLSQIIDEKIYPTTSQDISSILFISFIEIVLYVLLYFKVVFNKAEKQQLLKLVNKIKFKSL